MSLANWTTRILAGGAAGAGAQGVESGEGTAAFIANTPTQLNGEHPLIGTRVGAYLVTKRIGAGGVGEVFKGVDVMLKRNVAIKVLRDELASDPVFLKRFSNEAQLQAKLSHPNVAALHAFVQEGDKPMMVMEFVAGVALDEFVRSGGPVPVERALTIFRRALDGIAHAHANGIVHRDIKPANIMLADNGQVKVMDFGIARAMDSQEHLTRFGHVAGTAKALSPEQIRGRQADVRSDVYSLGIVLYTMLAGRAPFESGDDVALMKAQLEQAPPPLRDLVADLPAGVESAVMRALEKDPAARFQTVRDYAREIDACLAAFASAPRPVADRGLDEPTTSRTVINPVLQGVKQLPTGSGRAAAPTPASTSASMATTTPGPRWARVGAVSVAVLALGGAAALMWATRSHDDAAPSASAPLTPPAPMAERAVISTPEPAAAVQGAAPQLPLPAAAVPPAVQPVPARNLALVRLGAGAGAAARAADDGQTFQPGERIRLLVKPSEDSHVYCYLQDETRRILRFFPNRFHKSALVKAAAPQEIPGKMRFELVANSLGVPETIACFASARDLLQELPRAVVGTDLAPLPVASLDDVKSAFARLAGDTLAEASLRVQIK